MEKYVTDVLLLKTASLYFGIIQLESLSVASKVLHAYINVKCKMETLEKPVHHNTYHRKAPSEFWTYSSGTWTTFLIT